MFQASLAVTSRSSKNKPRSQVVLGTLSARARRVLGGRAQVRRPWATRLVTIERGGEGPAHVGLPARLRLEGRRPGAVREDHRRAGARARFVFPEGARDQLCRPTDRSAAAPGGGSILESHVAPGGQLPDLSATQPPGIAVAAASVHTLLHDLSWSGPGVPIKLGGF